MLKMWNKWRWLGIAFSIASVVSASITIFPVFIFQGTNSKIGPMQFLVLVLIVFLFLLGIYVARDVDGFSDFVLVIKQHVFVFVFGIIGLTLNLLTFRVFIPGKWHPYISDFRWAIGWLVLGAILFSVVLRNKEKCLTLGEMIASPLRRFVSFVGSTFSVGVIGSVFFIVVFCLVGFVFLSMMWLTPVSFLSMVIAFTLVFMFSVLVAAVMRLRTLPSYLLSLYLLSFANIVFISEVAGTLNLLGNQFFFLVAHLILTVLAGFVWWRNGRSALIEPVSRIYFRYNLKDLWHSIKEFPALWLLFAAVGVFYLFGIYLVLNVPPNNYDSMTCHMTRIGYWLQHGNFLPWPTWDYTQQVYPLNAQLLMMWTILFWGWDQLAGFSQWFSALAGMVVIFGIARLLGWTRPQSAFAALIWALFPAILLQSTTVQNHLTVGVLFACALYFLFLGVQSSNVAAVILSGIALALALGTHQLTFFTLPAVFLIICMIWLKYGQRVLKPLMIWGITSLVAILLVGSYMYIVNFSLYGDFFSSRPGTQLSTTINSTVSSISGTADVPSSNFLDAVILNLSRYIYDLFDLTGFSPGLSDPIQRFRIQVASSIFDWMNIPVEGNGFTLAGLPSAVREDGAWFGIIGFFLFPVLLFVQFVKGIKIRDPFRLGIFTMVILYMTIWSGVIIGNGFWSPYQSRYFVIMATIVSPFIAVILRPGRFFSLISWLLVITSISLASYTTANNMAKPLIGPRAIWSLSRIQRQDLNSDQFYKGFTKIEELVPSNTTLGLVLMPGFYEYPLFGKGLTRNLAPIYPDAKLADTNWILQKEIDWILLCKPLPSPQDFIEISRFPMFIGECKLLKRAP